MQVIVYEQMCTFNTFNKENEKYLNANTLDENTLASIWCFQTS